MRYRLVTVNIAFFVYCLFAEWRGLGGTLILCFLFLLIVSMLVVNKQTIILIETCCFMSIEVYELCHWTCQLIYSSLMFTISHTFEVYSD